ncbi:hypothetical protein PENTCL1PPCAC_22048 [Pristionchus entomophagus]|uniref:ADP ribosylation factor n=1 Tax=Pristionchus entomophagus TaxID=358040 RepID=A0AAV5U118_9BILA|nr:hypothetical protein PENTCL1PPCAC_22048 [Pristionchus entomophagus]
MGAALCCKRTAGANSAGHNGSATANNNNSINENKRRKVKRKIQMIALGVQDAGKTHACYLLKGTPPIDLTSSVGFSSHPVNYDKGFEINVFDVGGRPTIRNIWYNYLAECHAVIFVVNLQDEAAATIDESADLLKDLAQREDMHGKPIMLVLNRPPASFDEIAFVARMGLHEPPFNVDQRFHITRMHSYDGYLDGVKQKSSPDLFVARQKKVTDPLLEGFRSFVDKVIGEFVLLDVGVAEARRRLEERQKREKAARAARAAQREQEERDASAGIQETAMNEPPVVPVPADPLDQPGPSGVRNEAFEGEDNAVPPGASVSRRVTDEVSSPISRQFAEDDNISSDVFMPPTSSREPSIQSHLHPPPRPLPLPPNGETGIMGELSPQPERPTPVQQPFPPPTPAPRKISNTSTKTIFVDSRTTLKLSRMERIQKGIQSRSKPKEPILNGHVNTAYLPEVA